MYKKFVALALILLYSIVMTISADALPDLTVTSIATGTPSFINPSEANIPLTVTISNRGDATTTRFKLSVDVIDSSGRFVKPFTVPASPDSGIPGRPVWQEEPLTASAELYMLEFPEGRLFMGRG